MQYLPHRLDDYFKKATQLLSEGGQLVIMEPDDRLVIAYPPSKILDKMMTGYNKMIAGRGGDRQIGRKIPSYMENYGMTDIAFRPLLLNSYDVGKENYLDVLRAWAEFLNNTDSSLFSNDDMLKMTEEIESFKNTKGFVFGISMIMVKGVKK